MSKPVKDPLTGAETTGHVWDETLQEFNNPLPRWWLWSFYATFVFAIVYWLLYPSWPVGDTYSKGLNTITYTTEDGQEHTTHWNMRALLAKDMQEGSMAVRQRDYLSKVAAASFDQIAQDADMGAFVRSYGNGIFGDYCAACHQVGGAGVAGLYPNLVDDDWLWGGSTEAIQQTLIHGRNGYMPPFRETLDATQLDQVANYVLTLSGLSANEEAAAQGQRIFNGQEGGCYQCHTSEGKGRQVLGAPNLTDSIWTVAAINPERSVDENLAQVKTIVLNGINRQMPAFGQRLSETEIKVLTAYLQQIAAQ